MRGGTLPASRAHRCGEPHRGRSTPSAIASAVLGALAASFFAGQSARGEDSTHWSFHPLGAPAAPAVSAGPSVRTDIDRFIAARLEAAGLKMSARAAHAVLVRRIVFDLSGLPPSPEEVSAFVEAAERDFDGALDRLIDAQLARPEYGERWGRHWLDVARYADSTGQEADHDRPFAYPYRDYVIRAVNRDQPFDEFVRWQLAGDEIEPENPDAVAATGFLCAGPNTVLMIPAKEERIRNRYNELDDMVSTIGTGLLGITLGCARCHDHKYDAVTSREYYQVLSALHSGDRAERLLGTPEENAAYEAAHAAWERDLAAAKKRDDKGAIAEIEAREPVSPPRALAFQDFGAERAETWYFERGDFYDRDEPIELGFIRALMRGTEAADYWERAREHRRVEASTLQRSALADWITDLERGAGALLARVIVNRVWLHHFGEGLVRTPSDFGKKGEPPTHPELLEWLARDFVEHGWRLKRLHRLILQSAVYLQSSRFDAERAARDPENTLWWRRRPRRLEAEALRDAMLAVSGTLDETRFGPAFYAPIVEEAMVARNLRPPYPSGIEDGPEVRRRSVYMFHKRVVPYPLLQVFDRPDAQQSCGRRDATTVAPQALALLNDPFVRARAEDFARRMRAESDGSPREAIARGYRLALGRTPRAEEIERLEAFVTAQSRSRTEASSAEGADPELDALTDLAQVIFSLNEFLYID